MAQHDHELIVDRSEDMTSKNVQVQPFGRLKKAALAAAVGALVVVGVKHIQSSGSLLADTGAITNQAEMDAKSEVVGKVMSDWGKGLYHGAACKGTAEKAFTNDVVVDASRVDKNTGIYDKYDGVYNTGVYKGIDGLCRFFAKQERIPFVGFRIRTVLPSGYGEDGEDWKDGQDDVILQTFTAPRLEGAGTINAAYPKPTLEADYPVQDMSKWTIKDGKISAMEFYLGRSAEMDAVFAKWDARAIVQKVMGDWGLGFYDGAACKETAEKGPWAQDVVIDASGMDMKNTDIYKKYNGFDGLCKWFANQEQISFKDFKIESMLPRGNNGLTLHVSNTPTVKATGKQAVRPMQDVWRWTIKDGKISAMKFYFADAVAMDALFSDYDAKAIVQRVMGDWGMGLYHGAACKATAENRPWKADVVFDASSMDMKNTDIYRKYYGIEGLCKWFANQEQISFKGFKIESILLSGRNDVVLQTSDTPTVIATAKEADYPMQDMSRWTIKDGKISFAKFYFGDAVAMDALFAKDDSKPVVQLGLETDKGFSPGSAYGK